MKHAQGYFDNHNSVDKLYFTSDNLAFFDEQSAVNHAKKLDDETVTEMTREKVYSEVENIAPDAWEYDPLDEVDAE